MTIHRRDFLRSFLAAAALAFAAPPSRRVSLGLLLDPATPEGRGAALGLDEAHRVGELLHVTIESAPASGFALIGLTAPPETKTLFLEAAPQESPRGWNVTSSPRSEERRVGKSVR